VGHPAHLWDSWSLSSIDISNNNLVPQSTYIKKAKCYTSGSSFNVGDIVMYEGQECAVLQAADSDGKLKVRFIAGIVALAKVIQDSESLSKLTFCGYDDQFGREGDAVTIDTTMTEADFSGKKLGAAGAQILAAFMSTKLFEAKGSLVSLNLAQNDLGAEGARHVAEVLPKW
jgi:hypothetical protein